FYLDAEEYGIESYIEGYDHNPPEIITERERLFNALGGRPVSITEKEARFLVQTHLHINKKYNQDLPEGREKFNFMLKPEQTLTPEEYFQLYDKLCDVPPMPRYIVNHCIMRSVSGDVRGASYMAADAYFPEGTIVTPDMVPQFEMTGIFNDQPATLCRNTIEVHGDPSENVFLSESVIEYRGSYRLMTSEIKLTPECNKVIYANKVSDFKITSAEAAMLMNRSEYITVYEVMVDDPEFMASFKQFVEPYTETTYDMGKMYINFNETNAHVGRSVYRINDDIHAMYYLTDFGELLIMAYDFPTVQEAEMRMALSLYPHPMTVTMKYEFKEPVIYEFIKSGYDDFGHFLSSISGGTINK
ncbi:MAG: hypothetical protein IKV96_02385, partial [Firmicutes bacterium]|nr:hypothetical protein [Bacillota bacterium]